MFPGGQPQQMMPSMPDSEQMSAQASNSSFVLINIPYILKNLLCGNEGLQLSGYTHQHLNRTMKTACKVLWYNLDIETDLTLATLSTG